MSINSCTRGERYRRTGWAEFLSCPSQDFFQFLTLIVCCLRISIPSLAFQLPTHSPCLSISSMSIKVPLCSHNVNVEQNECIQVRTSGVWGYSVEISHWRKVNMVGVMWLEPDWERRRGHMGLIMAQLSDSESVFIDLAWVRILQTLELWSILMKPMLEIAPW